MDRRSRRGSPGRSRSGSTPRSANDSRPPVAPDDERRPPISLAFLQQAATHLAHPPHSLERLWEYVVLGGTAIITEEAAPLIGGLRARAGHLHLALVGLWIAGGTWGAGILLYFVGRWRGEWVRRRWPKVRTLMLRIFRAVRRHPWRASVATRFAWGLRVTLPIACGAARVPLWVFALGSGISALAWSYLFTVLGWGVGEGALRLVGHLRKYEAHIGVLILLALVILIIVLHRRHVEEEVVEALEKDD